MIQTADALIVNVDLPHPLAPFEPVDVGVASQTRSAFPRLDVCSVYQRQVNRFLAHKHLKHVTQEDRAGVRCVRHSAVDRVHLAKAGETCRRGKSGDDCTGMATIPARIYLATEQHGLIWSVRCIAPLSDTCHRYLRGLLCRHTQFAAPRTR